MNRTRSPRGRPPLDPDDRVTSRLYVRVTAAQRLSLRRLVSSHRIAGGVSGVIREAVDEYAADLGERPLRRR